MNYDSWRISFQDSEQAARAAFAAWQRAKGLLDAPVGGNSTAIQCVLLGRCALINRDDMRVAGHCTTALPSASA